MINPKLVGKKLRKAREAMGLSQIELAHKTGVSDAMISKVERGERLMRLGTLDKLQEVLKFDYTYILSSDIPLYEEEVKQEETFEEVPVVEEAPEELPELTKPKNARKRKSIFGLLMR